VPRHDSQGALGRRAFEEGVEGLAGFSVRPLDALDEVARMGAGRGQPERFADLELGEGHQD
jgi:hypothetical protein